jgi:hypothetical protein
MKKIAILLIAFITLSTLKLTVPKQVFLLYKRAGSSDQYIVKISYNVNTQKVIDAEVYDSSNYLIDPDPTYTQGSAGVSANGYTVNNFIVTFKFSNNTSTTINASGEYRSSL